MNSPQDAAGYGDGDGDRDGDAEDTLSYNEAERKASKPWRSENFPGDGSSSWKFFKPKGKVAGGRRSIISWSVS